MINIRQRLTIDNISLKITKLQIISSFNPLKKPIHIKIKINLKKKLYLTITLSLASYFSCPSRCPYYTSLTSLVNPLSIKTFQRLGETEFYSKIKMHSSFKINLSTLQFTHSYISIQITLNLWLFIISEFIYRKRSRRLTSQSVTLYNSPPSIVHW